MYTVYERYGAGMSCRRSRMYSRFWTHGHVRTCRCRHAYRRYRLHQLRGLEFSLLNELLWIQLLISPRYSSVFYSLVFIVGYEKGELVVELVHELLSQGDMWLRRRSGLTGRLLVQCPASVGMSLSKTPKPFCSKRAGCRLAWMTPPSVCECV